MPVYIADCDLPGITLPQLRQARQRVVAEAERVAGSGRPIRYLYGIWVPADWRVLAFFDAPDVAAVEAVARAAGIPFLRIVEAFELNDDR